MFSRNRTTSQSSQQNDTQQSPRPSVGSHSSTTGRSPLVDEEREAKKEKRKTFLGFGRKDRNEDPSDNNPSSSRPSMSSSRSANTLSADSAPQQPNWHPGPANTNHTGQRNVSTPITRPLNDQDPRAILEARHRSQSMQFPNANQQQGGRGRGSMDVQRGVGGEEWSRVGNNQGQQQQQQQQQRQPGAQGSTNNSAQSSPKQFIKKPAQAFEPLMRLIALQGRKLYAAAPPEIDMIPARATNGGPPKQGPPGSVKNSWDSSWMQLAGTSLSVWSMKATAEADKRGERVPPTYYNVTDMSLELLAPLPPPPHSPNSRSHPFVFSLNTAGSNRLLLSCPDESTLSTWVTSLRLASYEKSRIEEIYTGLALRTFTKGEAGQKSPVSQEESVTWNEPLSPLVRGKLEGWVRVRVMGGTEWKRWWCVLSAGGAAEGKTGGGKDGGGGEKEKKRKSIFGFGGGHDAPPSQAAGQVKQQVAESIASAIFFETSPAKAKQNRTEPNPPVLTLTHVSQAFAVFPEHLEVITSSNLMKVIGHISGEKVVVEGRNRLSAHVLIMAEGPEDASPQTEERLPIEECLRWCTGFHDAFGLYGRPGRYNWFREDPRSLFFAYPDTPAGEQLFLDPVTARAADYRVDVIAENREEFAALVIKGLRNPPPPPAKPQPLHVPVKESSQPMLSPVPSIQKTPLAMIDSGNPIRDGPNSGNSSTPPPANNNGQPSMGYNGQQGPRRTDTLTPVTEMSETASVNASRQPSIGTLKSGDAHHGGGGSQSSAKTRNLLSGGGSGSSYKLGSKLETALVAEHLSTSPPEARDIEELQAEHDAEQSAHIASNGMGHTNGHAMALTNALVKSHDGQQSTAVSRQPTQMSKMSSASAYSDTPGFSAGGVESIQPMTQASQSPIEQSAPQTLHQSHEGVIESLASSRRPSASVTPADSAVETSHTTTTETVPAVPAKTTSPGLQPPSSPDRSSSITPLLAPTPQRAGRASFDEGHVLGDDAALLYMMSLDETPKPAPSEPTQMQETALAANRVRPTIVTNFAPSSVVPETRAAGPPAGPAAALSRDGLARKPSGARAMPPKRQVSTSSGGGSSLAANVVPEVESTPEVHHQNLPVPPEHDNHRLSTSGSLQSAAMTALTYLDTSPSPSKARSGSSPETSASANPAPASKEPAQYKSSFAPSRSAAERRAKAEESERHRDEVLTKPGRAKVKARPNGRWSGSSDEEDEEEEVDEDSPELPASERLQSGLHASQSSDSQTFPLSNSQASLGRGHPGRPLPEPSNSSQRASRTLPAIPGQNNRNSAAPRTTSLALPPSNSYSSSGNRSSSYNLPQPSERDWDNGQDQYSQAPAPRPQPRTSMWNSSLDAPHLPADEGGSRKFVEIEPPAQLTKAFTPHGLLQAGLQDKEDRSARRQEEVAKETGSSLVNVPNKPPPPQTGLLGAITAHERDRKGAGGIGAALTERERDRRIAEERQRQIDDLEHLQRQQMFSQQSNYGGQGQYPPAPMSAQGGYGGMNAMPYNPSMMWGGGFNPYSQQQQQQAAIQQQAMFAAQQAYQSAMYALSMAGSQAGDHPGNDGNERPSSPMGNMAQMPMMPPMGMGMGMPGFGSPYMSPYLTPPMMGGGSPMLPPFGFQGYPQMSPSIQQDGSGGQGLGSRVPSLQLSRGGGEEGLSKQATGESRASPKPRVT